MVVYIMYLFLLVSLQDIKGTTEEDIETETVVQKEGDQTMLVMDEVMRLYIQYIELREAKKALLLKIQYLLIEANKELI